MVANCGSHIFFCWVEFFIIVGKKESNCGESASNSIL